MSISRCVASYFAERVEERLQSAGVLGRLHFVDVDGTAARQRSVGTNVAVQCVITAAVPFWSQILSTDTHNSEMAD